ncbi:MAG: hypothetical protein JO000_16300 [Alphaproteobacteria bacterium]|nr:hypothetical protein [Alphaproteobacteria bacterium]
MEILHDGNLFARVLLALATIGYGVITVKADFNRTHATNPDWTPHARFHVVWQITSYVGFGLVAQALIWIPGPYAVERLYLAAAFAAVVYGAFFIALATMSIYGGSTFDRNGYTPFKVRIGRPRLWDVNVTAFSVMTVFLVAGAVLIGRGGPIG